METIRDIYEAYRSMERDRIILAFKGMITPDLLDAIYRVIDSKMEAYGEDTRKRKKVYNVLVEALQNIYHHMEELTAVKDEKSEKDHDAMFIVERSDEGDYYIQTGNYIHSSKTDILRSKIEHINSLSDEELRIHYVEKLNTTELSEKGGAGLGIIDMARKSGNKLIYGFHPVSDKLSFFSLLIIVN
jgi:hypothetical protein